MAELNSQDQSPFECLYQDVHSEIRNRLDESSRVSFALITKSFHKRFFLSRYIIPGGVYFDDCIRSGHSGLLKWAVEQHCSFASDSVDFVRVHLLVLGANASCLSI
jgi:hypothetical protein